MLLSMLNGCVYDEQMTPYRAGGELPTAFLFELIMRLQSSQPPLAFQAFRPAVYYNRSGIANTAEAVCRQPEDLATKPVRSDRISGGSDSSQSQRLRQSAADVPRKDEHREFAW